MLLKPGCLLTSRRGSGSAPFTIASLFAGGYLGDHWDVTDTNTVYSDTGATTLITRGADTTVGAWKGKVNNTVLAAGGAGTLPLYKTANDTILFDGVDDYLMSAGNVLTPYPLSIVAIVDKTYAPSGNYAGGAVSASNTDHITIKASATAGSTGFADRNEAYQFSGLISMPAYTGELAAAFFRGSSSTDARLLYNEGTEASIAAPTNNTHVAGRVLVGAARQSSGTPSSFGGARLRALIVVGKDITLAERNNIRTLYGIV